MDRIKVKKSELLQTVKANREAHRETFAKACEGYRAKAIATLDAMLADAKAGKQVRQHVGLIEPTDQTRDYDRVIRMLEMSVEDELEISEAEFAQYAMDDWSWKRQFTQTTAMYMAD
jgi:hypothetical protein